MNATYSTPSVLLHHHTPLHDSPPLLDGYGSTFPASEGSNSPGRRQRISMACQYCRHRKIRCCGGAPCRNCTRAKRQCEYTAVPEEVNRATREKKAIAKATKSVQYTSPITTHTSYFLDPQTPVYDVNYVNNQPQTMLRRPSHPGHRRTVSMPSSSVGPWVAPPPAPALHSPPMFENSQWMYSSWNSAPAIPEPMSTHYEPQPPQPHHQQLQTEGLAQQNAAYHPFPSVLEQTPVHQAYLHCQTSIALNSPATPGTPSESRSSSTESDPVYQQLQLQQQQQQHIHVLPTSWSTSNVPTQTYLRPPVQLTPSKPTSHRNTASSPPTPTSIYHSPFPTPPLFQHPYSGASPSLGMHNTPPQQMYYSPSPLNQSSSNSPTLAPEMVLTKDLVGLGIGVPESTEFFQTPTMMSDEYFAQPLHF